MTPISEELARMTAGRALLVSLVEKYRAALLDPFISLLEVHKLMYFAQEAGEPLSLEYVKAPFGPYAEKLRHVLTSMEGDLISAYDHDGYVPEKHFELVPGAGDEARVFLNDHPAAQEHFARVATLVEGFESSFGLELLATVHWVVKHEGAHERAIVDAVRAWDPRKRMFDDPQIVLAAKRLADQGWLVGGPA